jgi:SAM-dependent methyltransferase
MTPRSADDPYGAFALVYDKALGERFSVAASRALDSLLVRYRPAGNRHLDLACGTAITVSHLERRGFRSTGVDFSIPMLQQARRRTRHLVAGDLRRLPFRGSFDLLTCLYDSLNHILDRKCLTEAFRSIRGAMGNGSVLLFDMNHPDIYSTIWTMKEPYISSGSDYLLRMHTRFNRRSQIGTAAVSGWVRQAGRKRIEINEVHRQRAYSEGEIRRCLGAASIEVAERIDFDPFRGAGTIAAVGVKMLFVCRPQPGPPARSSR